MKLETMLAELGYTRDWLSLGIVDESFVREQYVEFCNSDDKNQEHYRADLHCVSALVHKLRRAPAWRPLPGVDFHVA
jgi:hypothetical protein